jgi:hypothetical protein
LWPFRGHALRRRFLDYRVHCWVDITSSHPRSANEPHLFLAL